MGHGEEGFLQTPPGNPGLRCWFPGPPQNLPLFEKLIKVECPGGVGAACFLNPLDR